jgi:hypothetical protein
LSIFDYLILVLAYLAQTMMSLLRHLLTKRQQDRELDWQAWAARAALVSLCRLPMCLAKEDILQYHVSDEAHNRSEKAPPDDFLYPCFRNRCN